MSRAMINVFVIGVVTLALELAILGRPAFAQVLNNVPDIVSGAKPVMVEHIKVNGLTLEGSLEGDSADRDVLVFLPPSYANDWPAAIRWSTPCTVIRSARNNGRMKYMSPRRSRARLPKGAREMIVVVPDSKTVHNGSMYSRSNTTGDFENFIAHDVVIYIDTHYRTIARRKSAGWLAIPWAAMAQAASA